MQNEGKSRKPLLVGIIAAVVVLALLLVLLLTQCTGGGGEGTTSTNGSGGQVSTTGPVETEGYQLYWNLDREEYDGKSEAGMSSRKSESDGYWHIRFFIDGQVVELKAADRKVVNSIDTKDLMGLTFDENGIISGVLDLRDMPLEKTAWQFFIVSAGGNLIKANSTSAGNGMEALLEVGENTGIYDMTGLSGEKGIAAEPMRMDRIYAVSNKAGELTHIFIYSRDEYMNTLEAECEHCGETVQWSLWNKTDTLPTNGGHYQLQNDIQLTKQPNAAEDAKICLDLNGYRVDAKANARAFALFNVGAELAIMDTSEGQTGVMAAHGKGDQGMVVWVRYGVLYLYGGTLDASDATTTKNGTAVSVTKDTFFYMHGGEIIGGNSDYTYDAAKNTYSAGLGGSVYVAGKFVMNDGLIRDGSANAAVTYNAKGEPVYQRGMGGNLFVSGTGVVELNGGTIKNGKAGNVAANIYLDGAAELTINDGQIMNGAIFGKGRNGGNIYVGAKATVTMNGGRIYGGVSCNTAGNVYLGGKWIMNGGVISGGRVHNYKTGALSEDNSTRNIYVVNGNFQMYGGWIYGGVAVIDTKAGDGKVASVVLSGLATIDGGESSKRNLSIIQSGDQPKVVVGQMLEGSKVGINTTVGLFTQPCQEHNTDNFFSDIEGADVVYTEKGLVLGKLGCLCGGLEDKHIGECSGEVLVWKPWTSTTALPTSEGCWYLTQDVTMSTTALLRNEEQSVHVILDLNGKTVMGPEGQSKRVYSLFENTSTYLPEEVDGKKVMAPNIEGVSMQLTVTDSVGTGSITMPGSEVHDQGAIFWGRYNDSVINIYGGTFDASAVNTTGSAGGMGACTQGELNMYGGTFVGGNSSVAGGVVFLQGSKAVFNMEGGTIRGGVSGKNGGNVYIQKGATMNMSGGTIEGGSINKDGTLVGDLGYGGNIYVQGTLNMSGDAVITGGYVRVGVSGTGADGKAVSGGGGLGGNIAVDGTANLSGGTVSDGDASTGGNIGTISTGAVIKLDGVQVLDGKAGNGGNIAINVRANKLLEIGGKTLISGGEATNYGGNLYVYASHANNQDVTINITGGTITGGTSGGVEYGGGNIYLHNATSDSEDGETKAGRNIVTITGGVIEDGEAFKRGGNIFLRSKTDVVLDGGSITGGACGVGNTAIENGGSIAVSEGSTFTMKSGSVTGGTSTDIAGNIYINRGTLTISGGTISGGQANQADAANIGCVNGTLNISGGTIEGGVAVTNTSADSCSVTLSGKPYVYNEQTGSGIKLRSTGTAFKPTAIKVEGELAEGSKVAINANGYFSLETKESNKQYFLSAVAGREVHYDDSRLFIGIGDCLCGSTDENHPDWCDKELLLWQDWVVGNISEPGNYIVAADYTGENLLNGQIEVTAEANLNLNGKTLGSNLRVFRLNGGTLGITDHVGGGTVMGRGRASEADIAGTILLSSGTLNVYRGTLALDETHNTITRGGVVFVTGTLNLYDEAVVIGGEIDGLGGALYIGGGNVTLDGGRISGGSGTNGGNVYVNSGSSFTMEDGTIENGTALSGGNVFVNGNAAFTMNGGSITGGEVSRVGGSGGMGGNVNVASNGTASISGTVTGGKAYKLDSPAQWAAGGNLYVSGTLTLTNATVSGGDTDSQGQNIYINSNGSVTVTDSELLNDADTDANIFMKGGTLTVTGSSLTSTGTGSRNIYTNGDAKASITLNAGTTVSDGKTTGTEKTNGLGGNIYAGKDTTITLNGATIENGTASRNGGNVYLNEGSALVMESGTISGGTALSGGNVFANGGSSLTMNTGTVTGGEVTRTADGGGMGGNIYVGKGSEAYISGTVTDGKAYKGDVTWSAGGNLYLVGNTTLENLTVSNGYTDNDGHNIYVNGNVTVKNCSLENNADTGANILVRSGSFETEDTTIRSTGTGSCNIRTNGEAVASVTLNEGTLVSGGKTSASGGNIYAAKDTTVTLNGATVEDGTATVNGGNIYISGSAELVMNSGSLVSGGKTQSTEKDQGFGGNICVAGTLTMNDGTVQNGEASTRGGNLYFTSSGVGTMKSGTISGGKVTNSNADYNGGNVYINGELTMDGGTIENGTTPYYGGNIYVGGVGELTMNEGTVQNGTARNGGNIYVAGTVNMMNGLVSGGRNTNNNGGSIYVNGDMNMSGGTVRDGRTANTGGNFYVSSAGKLAVSGTAYITGGAKYLEGDEKGTTIATGNIYAVNGELVISGGIIDGDTTYTNYNKDVNALTISGKPVVNMGRTCGLHLTCVNDKDKNGTATPAVFTVNGPLQDGSSVVVSSVATGIITANAVSEEDARYIKSTDPTNKPITHLETDADVNGDGTSDKGKLYLGHASCECGFPDGAHVGDCDGTVYLWTLWTDPNSLPTKSGHYVLMTNVTSGQIDVTSALDIVIDLNGKIVTGNGVRLFRFGNDNDQTVTIKITDNSEAGDGKILLSEMAYDQGQLAWLRYGNNSFTMYGGTIDASARTIRDGKRGLVISDKTIKLYRGTILGGSVEDNADGSGTVVGGFDTLILGSGMNLVSENGPAIHVKDGGTIDVSGLTGKPVSPWSVDAIGVFTAGWNRDWNVSDYFVSGNGLDIFYDEESGELFAGKQYCVCGSTDGNHIGDCGGKLLSWQPWSSGNTLPSTAGNYYLTTGVTPGSTSLPSRDLEADIETATIRMDLNGFTISRANGGRIWTGLSTTGGHLVITDTSKDGTGAIVVSGDGKTNQGAIWITGSTTKLTIYGGTINASGRTMTGGNGVAINVTAGNKFVMYGGVIIGGKTAGNGGAICVQGSGAEFRMDGGIITNGKANHGGNVLIRDNAKFILNGGKVGEEATIEDVTYSGGNAVNGGNIFVEKGTLEVKSGTVIGGVATDRGGNIFVVAGYTMTMEGGTIENGQSVKGGNIQAAGTVNLSGGTVKNGIVTEAGGNIYVASTGSLTISGATIEGGTAPNGGSIYTENGLTMTSGVVKKGISTASTSGGGGNIYIAGGTVTMSDGQIQEGEADYQGGNVYIASGSMNFTGGLISQGYANKDSKIPDGDRGYGGNISTAKGTTFTMSGGATVSNGHVYKGSNGGGAGGNIFSRGVTNLNGGTITGGQANTGGNIASTIADTCLYLNGVHVLDGQAENGGNIAVNVRAIKTLEISGNTVIAGGRATSNGGNIYVRCTNSSTNDMTITMNGGTITGGTAAINGGNISLDCTVAGKKVTLNVTGGSIGGEITVEGVTYKSGTASSAGNIYLNQNAHLILNGGSITGGTSASGKNGGSIYIASTSSATLENGTVSGGKAGNMGGNVACIGGTLTVSGTAVVKDGDAGQNSHNIYVLNNGTLNLSGGTVEGYVVVRAYTGGTPVVNLSGAPNLNAGTVNLKLDRLGEDIRYPTVKIVGALTNETPIGITGVEGQVFAVDSETHTLTYADKAFFSSDNGNLQIVLVEGEGLKLVSSSAHVSCLCGEATAGVHIGACEGYDIIWNEWTDTTKLPIEDGYWYLAELPEGESYSLSSQNTLAKDADVYLDLNGQTVVSTTRVYRSLTNPGNLTITDSVGDGSIQGGLADQGGTLWITSGNLTIYGGTIKASSKATSHSDSGPAICVKGPYTVNMYGGKVVGGTSNHNGGAVSVLKGAQFIMDGGEIVGGNAVNGGCVVLDYGGSNPDKITPSFIMNGGTISGGTATGSGGCVAVIAGTFTMNGGTISGGKAALHGGNVQIDSGATFEMGGDALIEQGNSNTSLGNNGYGGNVNVVGTLKMSGGEIKGGMRWESSSTQEDGINENANHTSANVNLNAGTLTMTGGRIYGRVIANTSGSTVNLSGSAVVYNGAKSNNLRITGNMTVTIGVLTGDAKIGILAIQNKLNETLATVTDPEFDLDRIELYNLSGTKTLELYLSEDGTKLMSREVTNP